MLVDTPPKPIKSDTPDLFNFFNIDLSLLDEFDNDIIIKLEFRDLKNNHLLPLY